MPTQEDWYKVIVRHAAERERAVTLQILRGQDYKSAVYANARAEKAEGEA